VALGEHALAGTHYERVDDEPQRGDQPCFEQGPDQRRAAADGQPRPGPSCCARRPTTGDSVTVEQGAVVPLDVGPGPGGNQLRDRVEVAGQGGRRGPGTASGRPFLVGPVTHQQGRGAGGPRGHLGGELRAQVGQVPVLWGAHDAVDADEQSCGHGALRARRSGRELADANGLTERI